MLLAAGHSWRREPGLVRWSGALVTMLLLHAGAAFGGMIVWDHTEPPAQLPAAIMLELMPMPAAPPAPQVTAPPEPTPPPPEPQVDLTQLLPPIPELPLTPPDIRPPEVVLPKPEPEKKKVEGPKPEKPKEKPKKEKVEKPKPKQKPKPDPEPEVAQKPVQQPAQRQGAIAAPAPPAAQAAAPSADDVVRRKAAEANWQGILLAHLQKHQKYPRSAIRRNIEGTVFIRFRMDRSGKLLSYSVIRSSGHEVLDEEALAMMERADPLPPLPPELPRETIEIDVPTDFFLTNKR